MQGFELGSGTTVGTTESFLHLSDLQPDTEYDLYVRCVCDSDLYGEWAILTFHTDTLVPPAPPVEPEDSTGIQTRTPDQLLINPNPTPGQCVVQFKQKIPKVARLYTLEGALVKEIIPTKETFELTMPTPGVYLLVCEMKEGTVVKKVVSR